MATILEDLQVIVSADISGFKSAMKNVGDTAAAAGSKITSAIGDGIGEAAKLVKKGVIAMGASIVALGGFGIKSAADLQQVFVAFETMLGSAKAAQTIMTQLSTFAAQTPFQFPEIASASKQLIAFGIAQKDLIPDMKKLGDVASGLNIPLNDIAYLFGTVKTQGKAMTMDINQFANRGIPIWDQLAKMTGKSDMALRQYVQDGNVSFGLIDEMFTKLTAKGGQFYGMMEKQSLTVSGLWSTAKDTFGQFARSIVGFSNDGTIQKGGIFYYLSIGLNQLLNNTDGLNKISDKIAHNISIMVEGGIAITKAFKSDNSSNQLTYLKKAFGDNDLSKNIATTITGIQIAKSAIEEFSAAAFTGATRSRKGLDAIFGKENATKITAFVEGINDAISYFVSSGQLQKMGNLLKNLFVNEMKEYWSVLQPILIAVQKTFEKVYTFIRDNAVGINKVFQSIESVIASVFSAIAKIVTNIGIPIFNKLVDIIQSIAQVFIDNWPLIQPVVDNLTKLLSQAVDLIITIFQALSPVIFKIFDEMVSSFKTILPVFLIVFNAAIGFVNGFVNIISGIVTQVQGYWDIITGIFTLDGSKIGQGVQKVMDGIVAVVKGMSDSIAAIINGLIKTVQQLINTISGNTQVSAIISPDKRMFNIPKLASGGIVDKPTIAMIGESGREAVVPLENNTSWMDTLSSKMGSNGNNPNLNINVTNNDNHLSPDQLAQSILFRLRTI